MKIFLERNDIEIQMLWCMKKCLYTFIYATRVKLNNVRCSYQSVTCVVVLGSFNNVLFWAIQCDIEDFIDLYSFVQCFVKLICSKNACGQCICLTDLTYAIRRFFLWSQAITDPTRENLVSQKSPVSEFEARSQVCLASWQNAWENGRHSLGAGAQLDQKNSYSSSWRSGAQQKFAYCLKLAVNCTYKTITQ